MSARDEEKAKLKARLAEIEAAEKAEAEEIYKVVGRVVTKEREGDPEFDQKIAALLDRDVTRRRERSLLGLADKNLRLGETEPATGDEAGGPSDSAHGS